MSFGVNVTERIATLTDVSVAQLAMLVIPTSGLDVCRLCSLWKLFTDFGPSVRGAQVEVLGITSGELNALPFGICADDHRDVVRLPIPIKPWNDAADLNWACTLPEWRDECRLLRSGFERDEIAQ